MASIESSRPRCAGASHRGWLLSLLICGCNSNRPVTCRWEGIGRFELVTSSMGQDLYPRAELWGTMGYWREDQTLALDMRDITNDEDESGSVFFNNVEIHNDGPEWFAVFAQSGANFVTLESDCSVFWADGAVRETMNVVDGRFFAQLVIDTSSAPDEAPSECGPQVFIRADFESTESFGCSYEYLPTE